jgi:hypothetical protein
MGRGKIAVALIFLLIGGVAGGYGVYKFTSAFFLDGFYTGEVARTTINIAALENLRKGNTQGAIETLEMDVEVSAVTLASTTSEVPNSTKEKIYKTLLLIKQYREEYRDN